MANPFLNYAQGAYDRVNTLMAEREKEQRDLATAIETARMNQEMQDVLYNIPLAQAIEQMTPEQRAYLLPMMQGMEGMPLARMHTAGRNIFDEIDWFTELATPDKDRPFHHRITQRGQGRAGADVGTREQSIHSPELERNWLEHTRGREKMAQDLVFKYYQSHVGEYSKPLDAIEKLILSGDPAQQQMAAGNMRILLNSLGLPPNAGDRLTLQHFLKHRDDIMELAIAQASNRVQPTLLQTGWTPQEVDEFQRNAARALGFGSEAGARLDETIKKTDQNIFKTQPQQEQPNWFRENLMPESGLEWLGAVLNPPLYLAARQLGNYLENRPFGELEMAQQRYRLGQRLFTPNMFRKDPTLNINPALQRFEMLAKDQPFP